MGKREEICLRRLAKESDAMLKELIDRLKKDDLLDDTIIVVFADHSTYGFSDKEYMASVKKTDDLNLQQKTPLVIWGNGVPAQEISILNDTADLVPTIANLFGLEYDANNYLSTDIFSKNHDNYIYFQYGEWLDDVGNYSRNSKELDNYSFMNNQVMEVLNYNKLILQTDYFSKDDK